MRQLTIRLHPSDDGGYTVIVDELAGCITEGNTISQALANATEAILLDLEDRHGPFRCPDCGGETFGRDTARQTSGEVAILETVRCHDERNVGCRWRGVWVGPSAEGS